jgi:hypothetical protein
MNSNDKRPLAILMLACRDYEALELSLACHMAYHDHDVAFYILQNCRESYDSERSLAVARRYQMLFPKSIHVIERITPRPAYRAIAEALERELADYDLICKVDDDAFPINGGWIKKLLECWKQSEERLSESLAYVTPLINNNNWGFAEVIKIMGLENDYKVSVAREHRVGAGTQIAPYKVISPDVVETGTNGTIWGYPYLARWIHEQTTLQPDKFLAATRGLAVC